MSFDMGQQPFTAIEKMDGGLRAYFGKIYNYMAGGLVVSGGMAYLASQEPFVNLFYTVTGYSVLGWIAILAPLFLIFAIGSSVRNLNAAKAQGFYWAFTALMGVSLSNIFLFYPNIVIVQALLTTAGMFAAVSLYGYTTGRSLASWGSFLFMGLIGVILASIVNIFIGSSSLNWGLNVLCVFIFVGLTAYDTQKLKMMYRDYTDERTQQVLAVSGALSLYLDFINLFRLILYFLNDRR